jgi:predicted AAA+ superfamily ATPase
MHEASRSLSTLNEFEEAGLRVRRPDTLRRWMESYAAATASTASYEKIRDGATSGQGDKPAKTTTQPYRNVLERLWVVDPVPAWLPTRNPFSRLAQASKHHLCDPALAARLLEIDEEVLLDPAPRSRATLRDGPLLGALLESLVTLSVRTYTQAAEATVRHFRANAGEHEVDLIVERGDRRVVAIEVKLARTVNDHDVRHLRWLRERIGDDLLDAIVVTTGSEAFRRHDEVAVTRRTAGALTTCSSSRDPPAGAGSRLSAPRCILAGLYPRPMSACDRLSAHPRSLLGGGWRAACGSGCAAAP